MTDESKNFSNAGEIAAVRNILFGPQMDHLQTQIEELRIHLMSVEAQLGQLAEVQKADNTAQLKATKMATEHANEALFSLEKQINMDMKNQKGNIGKLLEDIGKQLQGN